MLSRTGLFALKPTERQAQKVLSGLNFIAQTYGLSYLNNQHNPSHDNNKYETPVNGFKKK